MPTQDQIDTTSNRIEELSSIAYRCHPERTPMPADDTELDESYHRNEVSNSTGWDTWEGLSNGERRGVLEQQIDWEGFSDRESAVVIDRAIQGQSREQWFDGITPAPEDLNSLYAEIRADEQAARARDAGEELAEPVIEADQSLEPVRSQPLPFDPELDRVITEMEESWTKILATPEPARDVASDFLKELTSPAKEDRGR